MAIVNPDQNDDRPLTEALEQPETPGRTALVPDGGDKDAADVDVAVAVATDMAITGG